MMASQAIALAAPVVAATLVASLVAWLVARTVARSERLLDVPGPRSSHARPTPRGGGLGIVLVGLGVIAALAYVGVWPVSWLLSASGFVLIAAIGILDDIRHRPVLLRLLVHVAAVSMLVVPVALGWHAPDTRMLVVIFAVVALVWSINLHNFMDGIDGLLALQAIWCGVVYAVAFAIAAQPGPALFALLLAAAAAGFLPVNWPRAKVFLGDGASGYIGLAIGWLAMYGAFRGIIPVPETLIVASAFLVDSGATLLSRMARGEKFWQAHREHLYQHLVHGGRSHARVGGWYMLWNLLVALPALVVARELGTSMGRWIIAVMVLAVALAVWAVAIRAARSRALPLPVPAESS